nr:hypothetical protein [Catenulispora rubra]
MINASSSAGSRSRGTRPLLTWPSRVLGEDWLVAAEGSAGDGEVVEQEDDAVAAVGDEPLLGVGAGAQRRRPTDGRLLEGLLGVVQKGLEFVRKRQDSRA